MGLNRIITIIWHNIKTLLLNHFARFLFQPGTRRAIPETEYYFGFLQRLSEPLSRASPRLSETLSRVLPRLSDLFHRGFPDSLRTPETFRNTKPGYARNYYINQIHQDSPEQVSSELITYGNTPGFSRTSLFRAYNIWKYTGILPNKSLQSL